MAPFSHRKTAARGLACRGTFHRAAVKPIEGQGNWLQPTDRVRHWHNHELVLRQSWQSLVLTATSLAEFHNLGPSLRLVSLMSPPSKLLNSFL